MVSLYEAALGTSLVGALMAFTAIFLHKKDGTWIGGGVGVTGIWILTLAQAVMYHENPIPTELALLIWDGILAVIVTAILFSRPRRLS